MSCMKCSMVLVGVLLVICCGILVRVWVFVM